MVWYERPIVEHNGHWHFSDEAKAICKIPRPKKSKSERRK